MPNRRKTMNLIKEIIRLKECNLSLRRIARALNVSRPTVTACLTKLQECSLAYRDIQSLQDTTLSEIVYGTKKQSTKFLILSEQFPEYAAELKRTGVTLQLLWDEYKEKYQDGLMYSQFCEYFRRWRKNSKLTMHIEHKAGEKMFVDFAGKKLFITNRDTGAKTEVEAFVATLGGSQRSYMEAVMSQKKEDWIKANENALRYFGGVALLTVPDCLKSGVSKGDKYEPDVNPEYNNFAIHYGTTILAARPYSPQDKALVENTIGILYTRIYAPLRNRIFYSLKELNTAILELLEKHNSKNFQNLPYSRMDLFNKIEKDVLQKLPFNRYEFKKVKKLKVQFNYHVQLSEDNHYYSVPYKYIGKHIILFLSSSMVEIYHDNVRIALHKRDRSTNKYTTLSEHMPAAHQFYAKWSPEKLINWGTDIGENTRKLVEGMLSLAAHPEQAFRSCMGLLNLAGKYGKERVNNACARALAYESYSYKKVKSILEKGMDIKNREDDMEHKIPEHDNIRGAGYYH